MILEEEGNGDTRGGFSNSRFLSSRPGISGQHPRLLPKYEESQGVQELEQVGQVGNLLVMRSSSAWKISNSSEGWH